MASKPTDSSQGKDTIDIGDGSVTPNLLALRNTAEELRKKRLQEIQARHESLLKELFIVKLFLNNSENTSKPDNNHDLDKVDQEKLREFLQTRKLEYSPKSTSSSTVPCPSTPVTAHPRVPVSNHLIASTSQSRNTFLFNQDSEANTSNPILTVNTLRTTYEINQQGSPNSLQPPTPTEQTSQTKRQKRVIIPPPERMVTRAASGAMIPKSVDEILEQRNASSTSSNSQTVIKPIRLNFGSKKQNLQRANSSLSSKSGDTRGRSMSISSDHDHTSGYDKYTMLSNYQCQPLYKVLQTSSKVLTTEDWKLAAEEMKNIKITQKIDELRTTNNWSFKQMEQHKAPPRLMTHWDYVISEALWMQTDFKEERRWKIAAHRLMAQWIMDYHNAIDKRSVRVKVLRIQFDIYFMRSI